jgi:ABC-2 type transport system ATP-binding protein
MALASTLTSRPAAVEARGLVKTYGPTRALAGLDLAVPQGSVVALLGPNGAGKTTAVRVLTTLLVPDEGSASVAGHDVVREPDAVRHRIGLTGQYAALDEFLTGYRNLYQIGRLCRLPRSRARARATELLETFDLADAADRPVKGYSGGMRRRLDVAASLVTEPEVLFLDEPTTGLDPRSRLLMWDVIRRLVAEGTSLLLTTQYLEEADQLADHVAVIDHGRVVAEGTPTQLKAQAGRARLELTVSDGSDLTLAAKVLAAQLGVDMADVVVDTAERALVAPADTRSGLVTDLVAAVMQAGVAVDDLVLRRPSLDDVFLQLTGHPAETDRPSEEESTDGDDTRS